MLIESKGLDYISIGNLNRFWEAANLKAVENAPLKVFLSKEIK